MTTAKPIPIRGDLVIRGKVPENGDLHSSAVSRQKHTRSSYSESPSYITRNSPLTYRPVKRSMPSPDKTIAIINASGRQAASLIRIATAVGYKVRAQLRNLEGVIATEVATNPNVTIFEGELYIRKRPDDKRDVTANGDLPGILVNHDLIHQLFRGAQLAFINTTFYGNENQIGRAIADAAKEAEIQHYIYSSMPDHAAYNPEWPSLPLWSAKHEVEDYIRKIGLPATFIYTGIYNNNFTSLLYPLFCMELQPDGSFIWQAPFHPRAKLPWLDAEHDVGPAILQVLKDGPKKWKGKRIGLAYEYLNPVEVCQAFERGLGRKVVYKRGPIDVKVKIPTGYREQLEALEKLFDPKNGDPEKQPPYFGDRTLEDRCLEDSLAMWEAPRGLEEYAREIFPLEEEANGLSWMFDNATDGENHISSKQDADQNDDDDSGDEGLIMKGAKRDEESWLA